VLAYLEDLKCSELSRGVLAYLDDTDDPGFPKTFEEAQSKMYQIFMTEVDRGRVRAAAAAVLHTCSYCGVKGHLWTECRQMKKAVESGSIKKSSASRPPASQPSSGNYSQKNKKKDAKSVNNLAIASSGVTDSLSFLQVVNSSPSSPSSNIFLTLDSGSSVNVFNDLSLLSDASDSVVGIVGIGGVSATASLVGQSVFGPAFYLEGNPFNIVSVHQLRELGASS
jgi:hypothetical protein